ncbi:MAG TPA: hypothetical protein PKY89_12105 [Deltaproteobacteria bacterium]|nr:hypothetical protein [Deltaproteobacteria bacterium]
MNNHAHNLLITIANRFLDYLPSLLIGLILIVIGWLIAWFVKRVIVQMMILLRFDRALVRFPWGKSFAKADVRYGLYHFVGSIAFIVIFLLFVYYALISWGLGFISELLGQGILLVPKIIAAIAIFAVGWIIAAWTSRAVYKFLYQERIPHATMIAYYAKVLCILLFSGVAFAELDIAREVVIIGFTVIFVTMGTIGVIMTIFHGRDLLMRDDEQASKPASIPEDQEEKP